MPDISEQLPRHFCWTKFGTEAGETVDHILARKELERLANRGVFLWGIGNSLASGIRALIQLEREPVAIFSPMRSTPKALDVAPSALSVWRRARVPGGSEWSIPRGSTVTSRAQTGTGASKRTHYALVCSAQTPISLSCTRRGIRFNALSNLLSGSPLGFSQVTAVVKRRSRPSKGGLTYSVGFIAQLVYPYFVELFDPETVALRGANVSAPFESARSVQGEHAL